jgi:2-polyprenyl-3-methyl-5-hydroxy-6-metoxy-1,4-benzoquinol methylase
MIAPPCLVCGSSQTWTVWRLPRDPYLEQLGLHDADVRKVMCRQCGLVYSRPQLDADEITRLYSSFRESPTPSALHLAAKQHLAADDFAWLRPRLTAEGRVLDVGCAEGSLLHEFQQAGWHCTGIEPSAFARFAREHYGLDVHESVFEHVSLSPASFDLVTALRVLEHVSDPRDVLIRIRSLLAPGGHLYLEVPDAAKPRHRLTEFLGSQHLRLFSAGALSSLLRSCGFRPVAVDTAGRGLRALAALAAPEARGQSNSTTVLSPTVVSVACLRATYVAHQARYVWKTRGRPALAASARGLLGGAGVGFLRRWRRRN